MPTSLKQVCNAVHVHVYSVLGNIIICRHTYKYQWFLFLPASLIIDVVGPVAVLFIFYMLAVTPWMYVLSFLFQSATTAYVMLFCLNFFLSLFLILVEASIALTHIVDQVRILLIFVHMSLLYCI